MKYFSTSALSVPSASSSWRWSALLLAGLMLNTTAYAKSHHHHAKKGAPKPVSIAPAADYSQRADVRAFADELQQNQGFEREQLLGLFAGLRPLTAVIRAVSPPRDPQVRSWQRYRDRFIEPVRINGGLRFWQDYADALHQASGQTGVPAEYIVAILGVESIYGQHMGRFSTFNALATLAFDYPAINPETDERRRTLFRNELIALLQLAREEGRDPLSYQGSYAGALGWPQFLPSSIRMYARDGDQDGHVDLRNSPLDAIYSVANFLKVHGWKPGEPVAAMAEVQGEAYRQLLDEGILPQRKASDLARFGVQTVAPAGDALAALIDLVSPGEPVQYRLGYQNFYVITRYNRSSFYALAVHELAQALRSARDSACCQAMSVPTAPSAAAGR